MSLVKEEGSSADVRKPDDFFETLSRIIRHHGEKSLLKRPSKSRQILSVRLQLETRGMKTIFKTPLLSPCAKTAPAIKALPIRRMRGALVPFVTSTI